jgi:hypothetical protein
VTASEKTSHLVPDNFPAADTWKKEVNLRFSAWTSNYFEHWGQMGYLEVVTKRWTSKEKLTLLEFVTVRLSLNFIVGCWGYTLDREDRVS